MSPSSQTSPILETTPWEERRPLALCCDDKCPWKHSGVTLIATQNAADDHVLESGHAVTVYREQYQTVRRA